MSYLDGPKGVGGWLAFFLVTLGVFTPASNLVSVWFAFQDPQLERVFGDSLSQVVAAEWIVAVGISLLCWLSCALFLAVNRWLTVQVGIATLVTLAFVGALAQPVILSTFGNLYFDAVVSEMGVSLVRPFIYSGLWTAYLLRSERVANTYRPEPDGDDIAEVFE